MDADTKVFPSSLKHLVNCMHHDQMIMGVCGETRIANKRQSWVTSIQVFEYFISHHLAKAFESVFGGVSCLPGCFSMFRLKSRKTTGDDWVPLIIKPEIVKEYSQSQVTTLHQKNLLLLGEDRFLTTILLRTFPNRKFRICLRRRSTMQSFLRRPSISRRIQRRPCRAMWHRNLRNQPPPTPRLSV